MSRAEFEGFFETYSQNVDQARSRGFWQFNDALIQEIILSHIPAGQLEDCTILDAGGGTGRWIVKLSKFYPYHFILYDLSKDMLEKARENLANANVTNSVDLVLGNLCDMYQIPDSSVDHVISIFNPVSFVESPKDMFTEISRVTKKGGRALIMGQGFYNSLHSKINNYLCEASELEEMKQTHSVKWGTHVPTLKTFTAQDLSQLMEEAGFSPICSYGIPVFAQPGQEDFDPQNIRRSALSQKLETDEAFFKALLSLEIKYNHLPEAVNRGMNIMVVGIKK